MLGQKYENEKKRRGSCNQYTAKTQTELKHKVRSNVKDLSDNVTEVKGF